MSDFIYTLNCSTIRPTPVLEKIKIAGEVGYKAIELWHDDLDAHIARGGTLAELLAWKMEIAGFDAPEGVWLAGESLVGPILLEHGTQAQRERHRVLRAPHCLNVLHCAKQFGSRIGAYTCRVESCSNWFKRITTNEALNEGSVLGV